MQTPDFKELENRIAQVQQQKSDAVSAQRFEKQAVCGQERHCSTRRPAWRPDQVHRGGPVRRGRRETIAGAVIWTGIPVYKLTEEETAKLLRMEDELHKRVIGQNDSIAP
jgi:ATP-dependent Clp protease ATP-binding subunit ClpC